VGVKANFSAADAALGYLYQVRFALFSSIQRLARNEIFATYIETLDDVVFENDGSAPDLLQLKHHCENSANLTDSSPDLWKSLRVWMEGQSDGSIPKDAHLYLVTTSSASEGGVVNYLMSENRNESTAMERLSAIAMTSKSKTNQPSYELFKKLSSEEKLQLISSISVVSNYSNIQQLDDDLRAETRLVVQRNYLDSFLTRLEGWWYRRAITQLKNSNRSPILSSELEGEINNLREQFNRNSLPVDQDILDNDIDTSSHKDSVFVQQIRISGIGEKRILTAIRDFYRAFEQRSRWIREDLLLIGELENYEKFLKEEWEVQFDRISDELGIDVAEDAKRAAAQKIYNWVENSCFPIRPQVTHPSITRGSFHILADNLRVGWHPEFIQRLQRILEPQGAA
jgi:hypothetical protein